MVSPTASSATVTCRVVAAFVAIVAGAPAAFAQTPLIGGEIPVVTIKYADLNLSTEEGSRALYRRLVAAAEQVCPRGDDSLLAIRPNLRKQRCINDTVQRAVKQIRHPKFVEVAALQMQ